MIEGQASPDDAATDRRRAGARQISVLINAGISHADHDALCRIRNLSSGGVMIECPLALAVDDAVELQLRSGQRIGGTVRWVREGQAGIAFDDPASAALVSGAPSAGKRISIRKQRDEDVSPVGYPLFRRKCWAHLVAGHKRSRAPVLMISPTGLVVENLGDWAGERLFGIMIDGLGRLQGRISDGATIGDSETIALLFVEPVHYRTFNEWLLATPPDTDGALTDVEPSGAHSQWV